MKKIMFGLILLLTLTPVLGWWDLDWNHRMLLNVTNPMANYPIAKNLTYGTHYNNTDCSDIRFINFADDTELDYWVEDYSDSSYCYVWVETRDVNNFYLYYGNNTVVDSASNITNTFIYGIDWTKQTSLPSDWLNTSSVSYNFNDTDGIILNFTAPDTWLKGIYLNSSFTPSFAVRTVVFIEDSGLGFANGITTSPNSTNRLGGDGSDFQDKSISNFWTLSSVVGGSPHTATDGGTASINNLYTTESVYMSGNVQRFKVEGQGFVVNRTDTTQSPVYVSYGAYWSTILKIKQTVVRSYTEPEPSYSFGSEEICIPNWNLTSNISTCVNSTTVFVNETYEDLECGEPDYSVETYVNCPDYYSCSGGVCIYSGTCGDGYCAMLEGETQDNCCMDCGCPLYHRCENNVCEETIANVMVGAGQGTGSFLEVIREPVVNMVMGLGIVTAVLFIIYGLFLSIGNALSVKK